MWGVCVGECVLVLACLLDSVVGDGSDLFCDVFICCITFPMSTVWLGEIGAVGITVVCVACVFGC